MRQAANSLDKERLEIIFNQAEQKQAKNSSFSAVLNKFLQRFLTSLTKNNELQVWQNTDSSGNTWWNAYDPTTGRSTSQNSESDLRVWIEERYYQ